MFTLLANYRNIWYIFYILTINNINNIVEYAAVNTAIKLCIPPMGDLRKTKRHIAQEISEWEEEHGPEDGVPERAPELEWGFMDDSDQPMAPG